MNKLYKRQWFKFWASDYLSDPKMMALNPVQKNIFITLLCLASIENKEGWVENITEEKAILLSGVTPSNERDWRQGEGTFTLLKNLKIIEIEDHSILITNFLSRQAPTDSLDPDSIKERVAKHREKKSRYSNDRIEENRIEKNRIEEKSVTPQFLKSITKNDITSGKYGELDSLDIEALLEFLKLGYKIKPSELAEFSSWLQEVIKQESLDDINWRKEARRWSEYWEKKPPKAHKLSFRNWLINCKQYAEDKATR